MLSRRMFLRAARHEQIYGDSDPLPPHPRAEREPRKGEEVVALQITRDEQTGELQLRLQESQPST